jgi:hypothetical protein
LANGGHRDESVVVYTTLDIGLIAAEKATSSDLTFLEFWSRNAISLLLPILSHVLPLRRAVGHSGRPGIYANPSGGAPKM